MQTRLRDGDLSSLSSESEEEEEEDYSCEYSEASCQTEPSPPNVPVYRVSVEPATPVLSQNVVTSVFQTESEPSSVSSLPRTPILRSPLLRTDAPLRTCFDLRDPHASLTDSIELSCRRFSSNILYRWRNRIMLHIERDARTGGELVTTECGPVQTMTFGRFWKNVENLARGCRVNGVFESSEEQSQFFLENRYPFFLGIFLETCKEWVISMHAALLSGCAIVTVYANLGLAALADCINETKLSVLVCDVSQVNCLDSEVAPKCVTLRFLIVVGSAPIPQVRNVRVFRFWELLEAGEAQNFAIAGRPARTDLAVVMYTSGTTGRPKGVMMTHANIAAASRAAIDIANVRSTDVYLSYLPLAHSFELVLHNALIAIGCEIGLGSPRTLTVKRGGAKHVGDMQIVRPTVFVGVPRVFDAIMKGVKAKVRARCPLTRNLFESTLRRSLRSLHRRGLRSSADVFLSSSAFRRVRTLFGGRLRVIASGGAPLSAEAHQFLQCMLGGGVSIIQGYGLTETCLGGFAQLSHDPRFSTLNVGVPWTCVEACLEDVPELGYVTYGNIEGEEDGEVPDMPYDPEKPPRGEILLRGPSITLGYFQRPELTSEVFASDKWFHTGDIGQLNSDGTVSIIDRKKNIVKLAQGEYIALEHLEMIYSTSEFVLPNGLCVIANSFKDYLVAIVLLEPNYTRSWASHNGFNLRSTTISEISRHPDFNRAVLQSLTGIHQAKGKKPMERIRRIAIFYDEWTPENGMLTASSKLKRRSIEELYQREIQKLFRDDDG